LPSVGSRRYYVARSEYAPVSHDHQAFLARALKRKGFDQAYHELDNEYRLVRELLRARVGAGLTQEAVAASMGTTKSAVSRLESVGAPSPSVSTLERYAKAVGCEVEIRLVRRSGLGARP
jgi:DNA-binding XRE family transcriptional regulator